MALAHRCPDGTHSRIVRSGPVGIISDQVRWGCPRCGWTDRAPAMMARARVVLDAAKAEPTLWDR